MIKLVASDLDGTLIRNEYNKSEIDSKIIELVKELKEHGIKFAAASGRQYANIRNIFAPVADEIDYVCENGALVVHGGEIVFKDTVDRTEGLDLINRILSFDKGEALVSGVNTCYIKPKTQVFEDRIIKNLQNVTTVVDDFESVEEGFIKISMFYPDGISEEIHSYFDKLCEDGTYTNLTCAMGGKQWLDFFHKDVHKGTALKILQDYVPCDKSETMVFGDNENDIGLMRGAKYSYCMTSGNEKTKKEAQFLTDDVATTLEEFIKTL